MKEIEIHNLITRLQGFDDETLGNGMTDGLEQWCQRRQQTAQVLRHVVVLLVLLLTLTAIAMTVVPQWRQAVFSSTPTDVEDAGHPSGRTAPSAVAPQSTAVDSVPTVEADYVYTGFSENGYSVTFCSNDHTVIYTRTTGEQVIRSALHNTPEVLFSDTLINDSMNTALRQAALMATLATQERDSLVVSSQNGVSDDEVLDK